MLAAKTPEKINDYVNSSLHKNNKTHLFVERHLIKITIEIITYPLL